MSTTMITAVESASKTAEEYPQHVTAMFFDPIWYRSEYPDVAASRADPVTHYLLHGAAEGRNPNRIFNTRWYAMHYPDVQASGMNPFLHFVLYGCREGRAPREIAAQFLTPTQNLRAHRRGRKM